MTNGLGLSVRDLALLALGAVAGLIVSAWIWARRVEELSNAIWLLRRPR